MLSVILTMWCIVVLDQRKSVRKVLKSKAVVALDGRPPAPGRCFDVGSNGVSINVADPIEVGQVGWAKFDISMEGTIMPIQTRVKSLYCIFSQGEFKVGFQFLQIDLSASTAIARYLR